MEQNAIPRIHVQIQSVIKMMDVLERIIMIITMFQILVPVIVYVKRNRVIITIFMKTMIDVAAI